MDYLIYGYGSWGHVPLVYSLGLGPKGSCLGEVPCHIKKKKKSHINYPHFMDMFLCNGPTFNTTEYRWLYCSLLKFSF